MLIGQKHRFAFCAALLLAACSQGGTEDPSVVLQRAATTAQQLNSAAFDVSFSYDTGSSGTNGKGTLNGVLADAGKQLSFTVDGQLTIPSDGPAKTVSVQGDVVVAGENDAYVRLSNVDGSISFLPGVGIVSPDMLNHWFSVGRGADSGSVAMTPDPSFIALQTQALDVVKDRSYEDVDGQKCFAYDVTVDPEKTVEFLESIASKQGQPFDRDAAAAFIAAYDAKGTIWIDATTSVIRRISWDFESKSNSPHTSASFSLHLSKHNEPVTIQPPVGAVPLSTVVPAAPLPSL